MVYHMFCFAKAALDSTRLDELHLGSYKHGFLEFCGNHLAETIHFLIRVAKSRGLNFDLNLHAIESGFIVDLDAIKRSNSFDS